MAAAVRVFVGTYTEAIRFGTGELFQGKGAGIHSFAVDLETGALSDETVTTEVKNPSYLCFDPAGRRLYAVNELKKHEAGEGGTVSAFAVSDAGRRLTLLNRRPTGGTDPCHVATDNEGRFLMVANFMSGSVSVYPILEDGSIGEASDFSQHEGSSVNPGRQSGPHAHSSVFDAANGFVFVPDLGLDRVVAYRLDLATGKLAQVEGSGAALKAGVGPRHLAFSPDGAFGYIVNELDSSVTACRYEPQTGRFSPIETVGTLPESFSGENSCADVSVHPSGAFVYVSNRGHDSIAVYRRDAGSGRLSLLSHVSSGGKTPRSFSIDSSGRLMIVSNQASDNLVSYLIDAETGEPVPTGHVTRVGTPVCVKFFG